MGVAMISFGLGYVHPGKTHHDFSESIYACLTTFGSRCVVMPRRAGPNLSRFRNDVVRKFLMVESPKLAGLLFVDTDMVFTVDDVEAILASPYSITSGVYFNPKGDEVFPVFNIGTKKLRQGNQDDLKAAGNQPFKVAGVGMGFCYIKRNVLETLGTGALWPFGEYMAPDGTPVGEDVGFSIRARHHGFDCWVNPNIQLGHIKEHLL